MDSHILSDILKTVNLVLFQTEPCCSVGIMIKKLLCEVEFERFGLLFRHAYMY